MNKKFFFIIFILIIFTFSFLFSQLGSVLESLASFKDYTAYRMSSYDRSGGNADGSYVLPKPGETVTLAEIDGAGAITHIWVTISSGDVNHLRNLVVRMYWDGETSPSVETPIGDFFGLGHAKYYQYSSRPLAIGTNNGMNSFWFMPFSKSAKITLTNDGEQTPGAFYYYIDYRLYNENKTPYPDSLSRFHAKYNQKKPANKVEDYEILYAEGKGQYVGCNISIKLNFDGWWGEGDDKIYIDGDEKPTLNGTGSEDYFCGAWCYGDAFSNLYFGCPLRGEHKKDALWNVYRYHIEDPIPFEKSIKVTIESVHDYSTKYETDDYYSVAYWYQSEPHIEFGKIPPVAERYSVEPPKPFKIESAIEAEDLKVIEVSTKDIEPGTQEMMVFGNNWSGGKQLWFTKGKVGDYFVVEFNVEKSNRYRIDGYFTKSYDYGIFEVYLDGKKLKRTSIDGYSPKVVASGEIKLGKKKLSEGNHILKFTVKDKNKKSAGYMIGIDCFKLTPIKRVYF